MSASGKALWHYNVGGAIEKSPKLGDLDGDGNLEVLVISVSPNSRESFLIWAFDASTGELFPNFPLSIEEASNGPTGIHPEILLIDLHEDQNYWLTKNVKSHSKNRKSSLPGHGGNSKGLHIVVSANKHIYFIEGATGCTNRFNVGENIRNMVLAGDITGNGKLSFFVTTLSGEALTFETPLKSHSLNSWLSPLRSRQNGFVQGYSSPVGIFVHERSSEFRDVLGYFFPITFEIFDRRHLPDEYKRKFTVTIGVGTGNSQIRFKKEYSETGVFTERIALRTNNYSTIVVSLKTEHGLYFEETFVVGYNVRYGEGLEWLIALPIILAAIPLILYRREMVLAGESLLGTTVMDNRWRRAD